MSWWCLVLLTAALVKRSFPGPFAMAALSMVLAGAVGNLIDRAFLGYVTDMFETLFMRFRRLQCGGYLCGGGGHRVLRVRDLFHDKYEEGHGADSVEG